MGGGSLREPAPRTTDEPRPDDVIFEGYELEEALERANEALEDDVQVLETDGRPADVKPFTRRRFCLSSSASSSVAEFPGQSRLRPACSRSGDGAPVLPSRASCGSFGHSPDPDDAFMYWGVASGLVDTRGFAFEQVLADIQTLNQWARAGRLEVSAISLAAYLFVQDDYALLPHGASIGVGYGPIVVARDRLSLDELRVLELVVPGS